MVFHFDSERPSVMFDILDDQKNLLLNYNKKIWSIDDYEGFHGFLDEKMKFDNKHSMTFFIDILRQDKFKDLLIQDIDIYDDIAMCHQDIVFAIGELNAYKPYITDFTSNPINHYGKTIYRYFPTFCDKRYLSTCGRILELLYNYWDKIGDLLVLFFPLKKTTEKIYFGKVIDNVNNDYHTNLHFKWLENFKENDYKELNKRRKEIVHYTTLESQIVRNYRENVEDFDFLKNEQEEKENFCSYFKVHYKMLNDGFYHSLKLIEMK
jgi:hypothetical protein